MCLLLLNFFALFLLLLHCFIFVMIPFTFLLSPSSDVKKSYHWNKHNQARIIMRFVVNVSWLQGKQLETDAKAIQHHIAHKETHNYKHRCRYYRANTLKHVRFVDWSIVELFSTGHEKWPEKECRVISWIESMPKCWDYICAILRNCGSFRTLSQLLLWVNPKVHVSLQPHLHRAVPTLNFVAHIIWEFHRRHTWNHSIPFVLAMLSLSVVCCALNNIKKQILLPKIFENMLLLPVAARPAYERHHPA